MAGEEGRWVTERCFLTGLFLVLRHFLRLIKNRLASSSIDPRDHTSFEKRVVA
jgi:hypothetical protein